MLVVVALPIDTLQLGSGNARNKQNTIKKYIYPTYTRAAFQYNGNYINKQSDKYMTKHQVEFHLFVLPTTFKSS